MHVWHAVLLEAVKAARVPFDQGDLGTGRQIFQSPAHLELVDLVGELLVLVLLNEWARFLWFRGQ